VISTCAWWTARSCTGSTRCRKRTRSALSRAVAIDRSSIARVVDKLVGRGLIARRVSEEDRRVNRLSLTDEGNRIVEQIQPIVDEVNQRILDPLDSHEREQFIHCLAKICEVNNSRSRAPLFAVGGSAAG
jgi:DNA-binding MarR family transcriptional regulator